MTAPNGFRPTINGTTIADRSPSAFAMRRCSRSGVPASIISSVISGIISGSPDLTTR